MIEYGDTYTLAMKTAAVTKNDLCFVRDDEGNRKCKYLAKQKDMSVKTHTSALSVTYAHGTCCIR
jgi:hypothetical protein